MISSPASDVDIFGERRTIDQIVPSVAAALGVHGFDNSLDLPASPRYVVFLVDGLGLELLVNNARLAPFLNSCTLLDSVVTNVPSTTVTSLTSLGTGARPGAHGVVGYSALVPGTSDRLNLLKWDQDVDPVQWQPVPTILEKVLASGVATSSVNEAKFANTGLTLCSQRGVPFRGVHSNAERHHAVADAVEQARRSLVYGYESKLDFNGHNHGVGSMQWCESLNRIDAELRALRRDLPEDCVLLVTADHGMINLPKAGRFDVDTEPEMLDDVQLLAGEARFRHLYTATDSADQVAERWRDRLGDGAVVLTREEAIASGWFGPVTEHVYPRLGDVMVASVGNNAVFSSAEFGVEMKMVGFHGSITDAEMRIPVLLA